MIKNEANEGKSLIGINRGQGNNRQEKTYIKSATKKTRKIKSLQLYERFQLQYEQEKADREKKQKEKLFQNVYEISEGRKNNTIVFAERKMRIYYITNIPWKTRQRKRKIN